MPTKTFQWKIELVFMLIQKSVTHETGLACIKANKLHETMIKMNCFLTAIILLLEPLTFPKLNDQN